MHFIFVSWHVLWIARVAMQAILLAILVRRKFFGSYPVFFLLTAWAVIEGATLLAIRYGHFANAGRDYYYSYRTGAEGNAILSFGVIYEILRHLLRDYPVLSGVGGSLYRWSAVLLISIALVLAWLAPPVDPANIMTSFFAMQRAARLMQCGLLVFLFVFASSFGLSWRNRTFGIALGFGIGATIGLITAAILSQSNPAWLGTTRELLRFANQAADFSAVMVWIVYVLAEETAGVLPPPPIPGGDLGAWNQELRRLSP